MGTDNLYDNNLESATYTDIVVGGALSKTTEN